MSNCEHNKRNKEKLEGTVPYLLEIRASKLCHQWTGFEQSRPNRTKGPGVQGDQQHCELGRHVWAQLVPQLLPAGAHDCRLSIVRNYLKPEFRRHPHGSHIMLIATCRFSVIPTNGHVVQNGNCNNVPTGLRVVAP